LAENNEADIPKKKRLPKFQREPKAVSGCKVTARGLAVIAAIARYRFLPTSLLVRLVEGNEDVTHRHLQRLFHMGLINRFALPKIGSAGEFNYFLDNTRALDVLVENALVQSADLDWDGVKRNKEKAYHKIHEEAENSAGRLLFLQHEVMISRFHFMLEMGCNNSKGKAALSDWKQGTELHNSVVDAETGEVLPHRPDAFFTLQFPGDPEGNNKANFFYEADRKTTSIAKMILKFRAHVEFIRRGNLQERYAIRRVRAVLVETLESKWAEELRRATAEICPLPLFWFTDSDRSKELSTSHARSDIVFNKIWAGDGDKASFALAD